MYHHYAKESDKCIKEEMSSLDHKMQILLLIVASLIQTGAKEIKSGFLSSLGMIHNLNDLSDSRQFMLPDIYGTFSLKVTFLCAL